MQPWRRRPAHCRLQKLRCKRWQRNAQRQSSALKHCAPPRANAARSAPPWNNSLKPCASKPTTPAASKPALLRNSAIAVSAGMHYAQKLRRASLSCKQYRRRPPSRSKLPARTATSCRQPQPHAVPPKLRQMRPSKVCRPRSSNWQPCARRAPSLLPGANACWRAPKCCARKPRPPMSWPPAGRACAALQPAAPCPPTSPI